MKIKDLRKKQKNELQKLLRDKQTDIYDLKIKVSSGNVKNLKEMKETKKDIARIKTLLNEEK